MLVITWPVCVWVFAQIPHLMLETTLHCRRHSLRRPGVWTSITWCQVHRAVGPWPRLCPDFRELGTSALPLQPWLFPRHCCHTWPFLVSEIAWNGKVIKIDSEKQQVQFWNLRPAVSPPCTTHTWFFPHKLRNLHFLDWNLWFCYHDHYDVFIKKVFPIFHRQVTVAIQGETMSWQRCPCFYLHYSMCGLTDSARSFSVNN